MQAVRVARAVAYESLVGAVGTSSLSSVIFSIADEDCGVDEIFGYWFEDSLAPVQIASAGRTGSSRARASMYTDHFYLLDPLNALIRSSAEGEPTRSARMLAADIPDSAYRTECFDRPGLVEKFSFVRKRARRVFVLNFYRSVRRPAGPAAFAGLAELVFPIMRKHVDLLGDQLGVPLVMRVERRLAESYPLLTGRERQVCARTLVGMTSEAVSIDLGIRKTTVLTYRRRAYERCRISGVAQLIDGLLPVRFV